MGGGMEGNINSTEQVKSVNRSSDNSNNHHHHNPQSDDQEGETKHCTIGEPSREQKMKFQLSHPSPHLYITPTYPNQTGISARLALHPSNQFS